MEREMRECVRVCFMGLFVILSGISTLWGAETPAQSESTVIPDPPFYLIRPGTPIADGPPPSWSHFIAKAQSKLASGDVDTLPGWGARMAARIRTVILADVGHTPEAPNQFVLRKIGVGLCMPNREGQDIVVSSDRASDLGFELGTLEKVVFESAEAELARGRLIVSTPTFAIYRSPTTMLTDGTHRAVDIFYGFLVKPETGELKVVVWARGTKAGPQQAPKRFVELEPNLVYDCSINVKASRLLGTIPISWSFAMQDLLPGRSVAITDDLQKKLEAVAVGKPDPCILEKALADKLTAWSKVREMSHVSP